MLVPLLTVVCFARVPAVVSYARALRKLLDALHQVFLVAEGVQER